ncbi:RNB domain-containing ribonuclease [Treponema rectale]|uniref:Exoribonuclease-2 n=1 Tax=Treponema rectale TaxID=744512 RepID=A0A840SEF8_9SPIR|nr:RNB domain-containing ribonuclease [Treponema rectale]MBB5217852.1 exoribonuclease-2 [Treponema rectale]QOS41242.1 RNB domain-containing ribonuclease [Treponema rectale]
MIKSNSVVVYKNAPAIVTGDAVNGKFPVKFLSVPATQTKKAVWGEQNVRPKDVLVLHEGPASSLEKVLDFAEKNSPSEEQIYNLNSDNRLTLLIKECWELLSSDDSTKNESHSFEDLTSLFYGELKADESWGLYLALKNTVYFMQNLKDQMDGKITFTPRSSEEIDSLVKKADEKGHEAEIRAEFITRLKKHELLPEDSKFMGDVEALALGKTDKSRTMHDAHMKETPEKAHKLLLDTGLWKITRNPHPLRWGLSMHSASECLSAPPEEERVKVEGISYAIDDEWSSDPDDAVAFDGTYLWVHIADPASSILPESTIDRSARSRGSTLYIPEGAARMLAEGSLADYALGLNEISRALSFRIKLSENGDVEECTVMKTIVDVKRLTYKQADEQKDSAELKPLFEIARKNAERRAKAGAVQINMPEVHLSVDPETKTVSIRAVNHFESGEMIREMMLLAGEGAAKFAFKNNIPFPYVSQDAPDIPSEIPEGLAGQYRLRRCMKRRSVGVTPAMHCGLGLNMYTQVTSPLRRYGDLIAHEQLRAFLDGRPLIDKDTMLMRVSEGDAAMQAAKKAERKSNTHWTLVYLLQNPEWTGEAVCLDKSQKVPLFSIPELGTEAYIMPSKETELNEKIRVKAANINIPELTVDYIPVE